LDERSVVAGDQCPGGRAAILEDAMARIGFNARLTVPGGKWLVFWGKRGRVPDVTGIGGHLGYWWVHENTGLEGIKAYRFRVQRDAVMWAAVMMNRAP
jgi:hypothetical protein